MRTFSRHFSKDEGNHSLLTCSGLLCRRDCDYLNWTKTRPHFLIRTVSIFYRQLLESLDWLILRHDRRPFCDGRVDTLTWFRWSQLLYRRARWSPYFPLLRCSLSVWTSWIQGTCCMCVFSCEEIAVTSRIGSSLTTLLLFFVFALFRCAIRRLLCSYPAGILHVCASIVILFAWCRRPTFSLLYSLCSPTPGKGNVDLLTVSFAYTFSETVVLLVTCRTAFLTTETFSEVASYVFPVALNILRKDRVALRGLVSSPFYDLCGVRELLKIVSLSLFLEIPDALREYAIGCETPQKTVWTSVSLVLWGSKYKFRNFRRHVDTPLSGHVSRISCVSITSSVRRGWTNSCTRIWMSLTILRILDKRRTQKVQNSRQISTIDTRFDTESYGRRFSLIDTLSCSSVLSFVCDLIANVVMLLNSSRNSWK